MAAEQNAARKRASAALAAVRTSAAAMASSATPDVPSGITYLHRWPTSSTTVHTLHRHFYA